MSINKGVKQRVFEDSQKNWGFRARQHLVKLLSKSLSGLCLTARFLPFLSSRMPPAYSLLASSVYLGCPPWRLILAIARCLLRHAKCKHFGRRSPRFPVTALPQYSRNQVRNAEAQHRGIQSGAYSGSVAPRKVSSFTKFQMLLFRGALNKLRRSVHRARWQRIPVVRFAAVPMPLVAVFPAVLHILTVLNFMPIERRISQSTRWQQNSYSASVALLGLTPNDVENLMHLPEGSQSVYGYLATHALSAELPVGWLEKPQIQNTAVHEKKP